MWVIEIVLKCLASVMLFLLALILAAVGLCGVWQGGVMFFRLTPMEIIAGLLLMVVSIAIPGFLALLAGTYGLLLQTKAYDAFESTKYFNDPETKHERRTEVLQLVTWSVVAMIVLAGALVPELRSKLTEWTQMANEWRSKIGTK